LSASLPVFNIGNVTVDGRQPFFVLGPCVMESEEFVWEMAEKLKVIATDLGIQWFFKASYDKANRSALGSYRGLGCADGCRLLAEVGRKIGVPVTTDIHSVEDAKTAAEHIDLLQIPAFLCRQTDLILAAGETGRAVNVKKGQFLAPWDVKNIADKLHSTGNERILFTERGTTFGYNRLVNDFIGIGDMMELGHPVCFDVTHSTQLPGAEGERTGGRPERAPMLARAAVAAGVHAIFVECHPTPSAALSDASTMQPLDAVPAMLATLVAIRKAMVESGCWHV
jgi:2-dehydro-3-deoxyphosphooctonate aldolase (KDO 8-P synthase)